MTFLQLAALCFRLADKAAERGHHDKADAYWQKGAEHAEKAIDNDSCRPAAAEIN